MKIQRDSKDQPFIEWQQGASGFKRAWIQRKPGTAKDWANATDGRYLTVARVASRGAGPAGNATDFPIASSLPDEQALLAFVTAVSALSGCTLSPTGATRKAIGGGKVGH